MSVVVLITILALIAVNALYVAAEFSAVGVQVSRIRQRAEEGDRLARQLLPVIGDARALDRYIAACQIGITISSLVLGAYGQATLTPAAAPILDRLLDMGPVASFSTAAILVLVGLTTSQMVLGELVPKSLALEFPTKIALITVVPMGWSQRLFSWFIVVLNGSGELILRLLGIREASGHRHIHSPDEIELLFAESRDGGLLEPEEHRRLRQALRLGIRTVEEIMVPRTRIQAIRIDSHFSEVARIAGEGSYTRIPVCDGSLDHIVGVIHARDVASRSLEHDETWSLSSIMRPALLVPERMTTERLLRRMREDRSQLAIVVDEFGGTAGLVSMDDILDEIVGDISEEWQPPMTSPEPLPDGRVRLRGDLRLDEAAPWIGVQWEGEVFTVGGRIMEALGRAPAPGDRLEIDGVEVEVERVHGHAPESVIVTPRRQGD
ncbi:MAG TPA: hemolysin family protein [Gemmatimonadota bacterium]|nr:hemolysin family protein [Gemmatimonadota bacterium]